jgi:nicotinamide-nucleotide amidase
MSIPNFEEFKISDDNYELIKTIEDKALEQAYKLLTLVNGSNIQIATSESLTAGLIMSTLVKIPWAGWHKYGCFGVYDTDAKRVFNSVEVDDVYTHMCAKEMAIGILKNSNATLAIAVTGNAMPYITEIEKLGEVFIGIAGYVKNKKGNIEIVYSTKSINACLENDSNILNKCKKWIEIQSDGKSYPPRNQTSTISFLIRNYTVYSALLECQKFYSENSLISPDFIKTQKDNNTKITNDCYHKNIPRPKYPDRGELNITCVNDSQCKNSISCETKCSFSESCKRLGTKIFRLNSKEEGRYRTKTRKTRKKKLN